MSGIRQTVAPAIEPVTRDEVKEHLRILSDSEDNQIDALIAVARTWVEEYTERQLITATWQLKLDRFPCWEIYLPKPDLLTISTLTYLDLDGVSQTLTESTDFVKSTAGYKGRLTPAYQTYWPLTRSQIDAVTITYTSGYGATRALIPTPIKHAIKMLCGQFYENREPVTVGKVTKEMEFAVTSLLMPYKVEVV